MNRALAICAVVLGVLLVLTAVALFITAIWTIGPDSARLTGTGFVVVIVAVVLGASGLAWLDCNGGKS